MGNGVFGCCDAIAANRTSEISLYAAKNKSNSRNSYQRPSDLFSSIVSNIDIDMPNIESRRIQLLTLANAKSLQLKILNSESLIKGSALLFKATGLVGSFRNANDGFTFFGCKKKLKSKIVNDFVIPLKDREMEDHHRGRHFVIYYKIEKDSYWIRDLTKGFGVFVRLDYALVLKDNMLINVGESFVVINLQKEKTENSVRLLLKVFSGNISGEIKSFGEDDSVIRIGRHANCNLKIEDPLLSKIQCSIYYNPISGWTLGDGDIDSQRTSTNGTWLYLNEDFEIYNGMIFKSHQTLFEGASLQNCNNQLVACLEELKEQKGELDQNIEKILHEKSDLERQLAGLSEKLALVNGKKDIEGLSKKIQARNEFDRTIQETEGAYMKILESSQTLLHVLKRESTNLNKRISDS